MKSFILCFLALHYSCTGLRVPEDVNDEDQLSELISSPFDDENLDRMTDMVTAEVVRSPSTNPTQRKPVTFARTKENNQFRWTLFVAHHKAGTHLLRKLAEYQQEYLPKVTRGEGEKYKNYCPGDGWGTCAASTLVQGTDDCKRHLITEGPSRSSVWFSCESISPGAWKGLKKQADAKNLGDHCPKKLVEPDPYAMVQPTVPPEKGIAIEANYMLKGAIQSMIDVHKFAQTDPDIMTVRFEDFTKSSDSFDKMISTIYDTQLAKYTTKENVELMKEKAKVQDLHRHGNTDRKHQSSKNEQSAKLLEEAKEALKSINSTKYRQRLQDAGEKLGYVYS